MIFFVGKEYVPCTFGIIDVGRGQIKMNMKAIEMYLYTIRHDNGVIAYVIAVSTDAAIAAVQWDAGKCRVIFVTPIDAFVLDTDCSAVC